VNIGLVNSVILVLQEIYNNPLIYVIPADTFWHLFWNKNNFLYVQYLLLVSQGQSFNKVDIYLSWCVFNCGQL